MALLDRCIFNPVGAGTADFQEGTVVTGYQSMEAAGAVNSGTYSYVAQSSDLMQWEVGVGTYVAGSPSTLRRTTIQYNSLGTTARVYFDSTPQVMLTALASDFIATQSEFGWQDIKTDWGATGNGVTDDTQAFLNFQTWAQAQTTGVVLVIPPGIYIVAGVEARGTWSGGAFFTGISDITIYGYGATLSNFGNHEQFYFAPVGVQSTRINSTKSGDTTVTLVTTAQTSILTLNSWVCISSLDLQGGGRPPNWYYNEYRQITNINAGTGVVTLDQPLRYAHLSTFPCPSLGGSQDYGGPASIFNMEQTWVQNVRVYGLTVGTTGAGVGNYFSARSIELVDMTFANSGDVAVSACERAIFRNCYVKNSIASNLFGFDKDISYCELINCTIETPTVAPVTGSLDRIIIDGCEIYGTLGNTAPKEFAIRNSYIQNMVVVSTYGPGGILVLENNRIPSFTYGFSDCWISAADLSFSAGTFYMANTSPNIALMWIMAVPGAQCFCMFGANGAGAYPFLVTGARQDGTNTYMDTTLQALPPTQLTLGGETWPFYGICSHPCARLSAKNNTGCAAVIDASKGQEDNPALSYYKRVFTGSTSAAFTYDGIVIGNNVQITINVIQAYSGVQSTLNFGFLSLNVITDLSAGTVTSYSLGVNAKIAGKRTLTPAGTTGSQSGDNISAISGWLWMDPYRSGTVQLYFDHNITSEAINLWPLIEVEIITDQGITALSTLWINSTTIVTQ